jgi:hypothetical protein
MYIFVKYLSYIADNHTIIFHRPTCILELRFVAVDLSIYQAVLVEAHWKWFEQGWIFEPIIFTRPKQ